jgi:acyl carrier protein
LNSLADMAALIRDGLGIPITEAEMSLSLGELPGWDSVHLLWLHTVLEHATGREIAMPDLLEAPDLASIYRLAVTP